MSWWADALECRLALWAHGLRGVALDSLVNALHGNTIKISNFVQGGADFICFNHVERALGGSGAGHATVSGW